jgi:hypothetical protein
MKIDPIRAFFALAGSSLFAYSVFHFHVGSHDVLLVTGSATFLFTTLLLSLAADFNSSRATVNIRALSGIFAAICILVNVIFAFTSFIAPVYILTAGSLYLTYLIIVYSIKKADQ